MEALNLKDRFRGLNIEELSVLDVGCGNFGSPLSAQMRDMPFSNLIAIDIHAPLVKELTRIKPKAKTLVALVRDARTYLPEMMSDGVDVVIFMDMVEHVSKEEGIELLRQAQRIARKRVLVWMPLGEAAVTMSNSNPYSTHRSVWEKEDLELLGFTVTIFKDFHQHVSPPADAAWAVWGKKKTRKQSLSID